MIDAISYSQALDAQAIALASARLWYRNTTYQAGDICIFNSDFWQCNTSHQSTSVFDYGYWTQLNSNSSRIQGVQVDDSGIGDGKALVYNNTTHKLEYRTITPNVTGATIDDSAIAGTTDKTFSVNKILTIANTKPNTTDLSTVATSGKYSDLTGLPAIPSKTSALTNDSNYIVGTLDTDPTLLANSDSRLSTQKSIKSYVDNKISSVVAGSMTYKGVWDASTGVYPSNVTNGWYYMVSVTGTINSIVYNVNDIIIANATVSGATTSSNWNIINNSSSSDVLRESNISTNTDFTIDTGKLTDRNTIKTYVDNTKINKISSPIINNIAVQTSDGSLSDGGKKISDLALITDIGNISNLNSNLVSNLISNSESINLINAINLLFQSGVDDKNALITALTSKNITTTGNETLEQLINKVNDIASSTFNGSNIVEITKLNITGSVSTPYIKTVNLNSQIKDLLILASIRKYTEATTKNQLISTFDNSDSSSFNVNNNIIYDGDMHLATKTEINNMIDKGTFDTGELWNLTFNKSDFSSITSVSDGDSTDGTPQIIINGTNIPQIVTANSDINITGISSLNGIIFDNQTSNGGNCLIAISFNSGGTYYAYDTTSNQWITVDVTNITSFKNKGMSKNVTDTLTNTQLEAIRNGSKTIRFAYYLSVVDSTSVANNQDLSINVTMPGTYTIPDKSTYDISIGSDNKSIIFKIYDSGTYSMDYVNN